ncbi:hypothetical protein LSAT2_029268, partial [Lamellibrachia satsuma]
ILYRRHRHRSSSAAERCLTRSLMTSRALGAGCAEAAVIQTWRWRRIQHCTSRCEGEPASIGRASPSRTPRAVATTTELCPANADARGHQMMAAPHDLLPRALHGTGATNPYVHNPYYGSDRSLAYYGKSIRVIRAAVISVVNVTYED